MRTLRLPQMNHLMVLERIEPTIQTIGHRLLTGVDTPEEGDGLIAFAAPQSADGGPHVECL